MSYSQWYLPTRFWTAGVVGPGKKASPQQCWKMWDIPWIQQTQLLWLRDALVGGRGRGPVSKSFSYSLKILGSRTNQAKSGMRVLLCHHLSPHHPSPQCCRPQFCSNPPHIVNRNRQIKGGLNNKAFISIPSRIMGGRQFLWKFDLETGQIQQE